VEPVATLDAALVAFQTAGDTPFHLLVVDLEAGVRAGREAAAAAAELAPQLLAFGELPVAFCTRAPDPQLELLAGPGLGAVALDDPDPSRCAVMLDWLLGIKRMDGAASG
jgi:hypothetical protein